MLAWLGGTRKKLTANPRAYKRHLGAQLPGRRLACFAHSKDCGGGLELLKCAGAQDAYEQLAKAAAQQSPPATTGAAVNTELNTRHTEDKGGQHQEQRRTSSKLPSSACGDTPQSINNQDGDAAPQSQGKEQLVKLVDTPSWQEYTPPAGIMSLDLDVLVPTSHKLRKKARCDGNVPLSIL